MTVSENGKRLHYPTGSNKEGQVSPGTKVREIYESLKTCRVRSVSALSLLCGVPNGYRDAPNPTLRKLTSSRLLSYFCALSRGKTISRCDCSLLMTLGAERCGAVQPRVIPTPPLSPTFVLKSALSGQSNFYQRWDGNLLSLSGLRTLRELWMPMKVCIRKSPQVSRCRHRTFPCI